MGMWGARKWIRCATIRCKHVPTASHVQAMYKYQSLEAWKRAHAAAVLIMRVTDEPHHPRTRSVFEQLRRAAVSVEANIVEGYALTTPALYRRHLRIGMGSAAEAECLARIAGELGYLSGDLVKQIETHLGGAMRRCTGCCGGRRSSTPDC